jgi:hypothetical protein
VTVLSDPTSILEPEQARPRRLPEATGSSSAAQRSVPVPGNARRGPETREHSREWSRRTR